MFKAKDVEELLKIADYGEDYIPSQSGKMKVEQSEELPNSFSLAKSSNILGINHDTIMKRVLFL